MKILIIEDEKHNADRLKRLLHGSYPDAAIYGPLRSIEDIRSFFGNPPEIDIILADIRLADGLSFDALSDIPGDIPIIFTTAYDEYALKAFHYNGIAYLLKPVEKEELSEAVEKCLRMTTVSASKEIAGIYRLLSEKPEVFRKRFLVALNDGYITVPVFEISFISTDSGRACLHLKDKRTLTLDMTLDEIDSQLDPTQFFRATRQHIVNVTSVRRISNWFNRKIKVILAEYPEAEIVVGKEKVPRLKQWLDC